MLHISLSLRRNHTLFGLLFFSIFLSLQGMQKMPAELPAEVSDLENLDAFDKHTFESGKDFAEILSIIKRKHYDPEDKLAEAMPKAFETLLSEFDPHSSYLGPKAYQNIVESTSGSFFGIGVVIDNTRNQKDKVLTIIETIPDGPAYKAGVKSLDKIVEIEGKPLEGMSTEEAMAHLKGKQNTKVTIKVMRGEKQELLTYEITRDVIKERNSLCFHLKDQDIYYISLNMFTEQAMDQIKQLLQESRKNNYKGLILDLRNNSGGLLMSAINIAGLFVPKGSEIVTTRDKHNKVIDRYTTKTAPIRSAQTPPIFILINNYTASAAEILAGALKIHAETSSRENPLMVFLVGTPTFGKGSVQEIIPISNNSALKLTTSLYYLPQDTPVQGSGIQPDFWIEKLNEPPEQVAWFKKHYGSEKNLSKYIKPIGFKEPAKKEEAKNDKDKPWTDRFKEMLKTDNQFLEAIRLVTIFDNFRKSNPEHVKTLQQARTLLKNIYPTDEKIEMTEVKV